MTSDDHRIRLRLLFDQSFELDHAAREAHLGQACPDPALRAEVHSLLKAYDEAPEAEPLVAPEALLGISCAINQVGAEEMIGRRIGAYRIAAEIGHGGMGTVYRAVRDDGRFEKTVAVKVIRAGMDSAAFFRRFEAEQRILGGLDHPYITRLLDGGRTESGLPYFIMEYVEGEPIDDYCDARRLGLRERLQLFTRVCEAVQYAHAKLVVHRDLKPGNILITEDEADPPVPKLLDFGIARLLLPEPGESAGVYTTAAPRMMTPAYASPEQLRGEPVSTATDVYALGVVLYRLLAGRLPYQADERSMEAVRNAVLEEMPARPSSLVIRPTGSPGSSDPERVHAADREVLSPQRGTTPETFRRRLAGDLDTIVLKALRKEPERRYGSAEQLAEDVRRYLDGRPILAHPDSLRYRSRKFVRRHWRAVGAAAMVIVALLGGIAATLWQARVADAERTRAERRFNDVRKLAGAFLFEFHDAIADLPGATPARELIVDRALEYLDELALEADDDPTLLLELAEAYRRVADVQGNPTNANLGRTDDAVKSYRQALDLLNAASRDMDAKRDPAAAAQLVKARAGAREGLADVLATAGDLEGAQQAIVSAVEDYRELSDRFPAEIDYVIDYAVGLIKQGDLMGNPNFPNLGRDSAALRLYHAAEPILDALHESDSTHQRVFRLIGLIEERIGTMHLSRSETDEARQALERSLGFRVRYARDYPHDLDGIRDLAVAHEKMGLVALANGDFEESLSLQRRATTIFRSIAESDSLNVQAWQTLAVSQIHQGNVEIRRVGQRGESGDRALKHFEEALRLLRSIRRIDPDNLRTQTLIERAERGLESVYTTGRRNR